jgi:SAM-dependent methyltransferase
MNDIPVVLRDFDFTWSCCSFEHLGSIEHGMCFMVRMMDCLKPGGVAVHATEFNFASNLRTVDHATTVLFRRRDVQDIVRRLRRQGHAIEVDYSAGDGPADRFLDTPPFCHDPHLKLRLRRYVATSIGLIVTKRCR